MHQHKALVIQWNWKVFSESGGLRPDPFDTVRLYTDSAKVDLTGKQVDYLARCVKMSSIARSGSLSKRI